MTFGANAVFASAEDVIFGPEVNTADCIGAPINNETTDGATVNYKAEWAECKCVEGEHVDRCDDTGVDDNHCTYTFACEKGYTYDGADGGSGVMDDKQYNKTTESCTLNSYTITYYVDGVVDNTANNITTYNVNTSTSLNDYVAANHDFSGWYECDANNMPDTSTEKVTTIAGRFASNPKNLKLCGTASLKNWTIHYYGCIDGDCTVESRKVYLNELSGVTGLAPTSYTYGQAVNFPTSGTMTVPRYQFGGVWYRLPTLQNVRSGVTATTTGDVTVYTRLNTLCCTNDTYLNPSTGMCGMCPEHSHVVSDASGCGQSCECDDNYEFENNSCNPKSYEITLEPNGGDYSGTQKIYTKYTIGVYLDAALNERMSSVNYPVTAPNREGYTFAGYYDTASDNNAQKYIEQNRYLNSDGDTAGRGYTSNQTWYAHWTINEYTVSYDGGYDSGGNHVTTVAMSPHNEQYNATVELHQNTYNAYAEHNVPDTFVGWSCVKTGTDEEVAVAYNDTTGKYTISMPASDVTCVAQWNPCDACNPGEGCTCNLSVENNQCVYDTNALTGYTLVRNDGEPNPVCEPVEYSVDYYCDSEDTTPTDTDSPRYYEDAVTVKPGSTCSSNDSVFTGWICEENTYNPDDENNDSFTMPAHNVTCVAQWNPCDACNPGEGCTCDLSVANNQCVYNTNALTGYTLVRNDGKPNPVCDTNSFNIIYNPGSARNSCQLAPVAGHRPTGTMNNQSVAYKAQNISLNPNGFSVRGYHQSTPLWVGDYNVATGAQANTLYADGASIEQYNLTNDLTLTAQWEPNEWNIIYNTGTAGNRTTGFTGSVDNQPVSFEDCDVELSKNKYGITGYTFAGWVGDYNNANGEEEDTSYDDEQELGTYNIDADLNLYAQWTPKKYKITYNSGSCTEPNQNPLTHDAQNALTYDTEYTLAGLDDIGFSEPDGYEFLGWSTSSSMQTVKYQPETQYGPWTTDGNLVVYAVCAPKRYKITYDGGYVTDPVTQASIHVTQVAMNPQVVVYGTSVTLNPNTYVYAGWSPTGWDCTVGGQTSHYADQASMTYNYTDNMNCEMQWKQDSYRVRYDCNGADGDTPPTDTNGYAYETFVTTQPNSCTYTGHSFDYWLCDEEPVVPGYDFYITGDTTCMAHWNVNTYDAEYHKGTCDTVSGNLDSLVYTDSDALTYGQDYTLANSSDVDVAAPLGYEFLGWTTQGSDCADADCVTYEAGDQTDVWTTEDNLVVYGVCALKDYTITYDHQGGHFADDANPLYEYTIYTSDENAEPSLPDDCSVINGCYVFDNWYDNPEYNGSPYNVVPGSALRANPRDITLYAKWLEAGEIIYDCDVAEDNDNIIISRKREVGTIVNAPLSRNCGISECEIDYWLCDTNYDDIFDLDAGDTAYEPGDAMQITENDRPLNCKAVQTCANVDYPITYVVYAVDSENNVIGELDTVKLNNVNTAVEDITPDTYRISEPVNYPTISLDGYSFEGWYDTFENGVFSNPVTSTPTEEPGWPVTVYGKMVLDRSCEIRYHNVEGVTYPNGTNPNTYVLATPSTTPIVALHNPDKSYYEFKGWHLGSADGELVTQIDYNTGINCGIDLYAEWEFICNATGNGHWLHIGDNPDDKVCLYETRQAESTPAVRVKRSDETAEPYYLMLSEDTDTTIHEGSNKKMRIRRENQTYNVCDRSTCPDLL